MKGEDDWCEKVAREGGKCKRQSLGKSERALWSVWEMHIQVWVWPLQITSSKSITNRWKGCVELRLCCQHQLPGRASVFTSFSWSVCNILSLFNFWILLLPYPWSISSISGSRTVQQYTSYCSFSNLRLRVIHKEQTNKFWSMSSAKDFTKFEQMEIQVWLKAKDWKVLW